MHHPDKSSCPQASEKFKEIREAYETLRPMRANMDAEVPMQANKDAEEDATETTNAGQSAAAWLGPDWMQPDYIPTFEVAYPGPKWHPVNEEISKEMYTAYLTNIPGHYTEPLTANEKGGTRQYIVDWEQMIQTNIENGRQRSVRFRGPHEDDHRRILTGKLR